jgi:uncharacterized protein YbcI
VVINGAGERLEGGRLNSALASEIVGVMAQNTGRGPTRSRAFIHDDVVVCLLEQGMTKAEKKLVASGEEDTVNHTHGTFQRVMEDEMVAVVERLTGRKVLSFMSGNDARTDRAAELFVLESASER